MSNFEKLITHKDCYNYILDTFNENDIKFVIIRGFINLPRTMDTDLDIIIHPNSYNRFKEICNKFKDNNLIRNLKGKRYTENKKVVHYVPFVTEAHFTEGNHLPGKRYRYDTYSDLFFFKDGEGGNKPANAIILNSLFKKYVFDNKIKKDNYYIPNPISEIILLIYRNLYDLGGHWKKKHSRRIGGLLSKTNKDEFVKVCNFCFSSEQNILELLQKSAFTPKFPRPNQKLNLFLIRKKGMKKDIIENILNKIEKDYQIIDKILININNKQKFYKSFYGNYTEHEKDILCINDNQCLAIITNIPNNKNPNVLKVLIRKEYKKFYPPIGNIIHCSDSTQDCEKELNLLFNESIENFNNIGTYYSQKNI